MAPDSKNKQYWNDTYQWGMAGEEWSGPWGNSTAQFYCSIMPRISSYLPAATILEIAPGFGRWTVFLKRFCTSMTLVDVADRCIEACRDRFRNDSHLSFHVNDGQSLDMVPDSSVDFVFSFDSLVHVEAPVVESYLRQVARKLTKNGVAFLHHSNIGEYTEYFARLPQYGPLRKPLAKVGLIEATGHGRARTMSATKFREFADSAGLSCISQELVNWITKPDHLIDCFSVCTLPGSKFEKSYSKVENRNFMSEAKCISRLADIQDSLSREGV